MKYSLAILFTQPPFGTATSREGLDALLAASAFCAEDEIAVLFWQDGVYNLLAPQQPSLIQQKDHIATFKLLDLYELRECFVCAEDLHARGLADAERILPDVQLKTRTELRAILAQSAKVLTF